MSLRQLSSKFGRDFSATTADRDEHLLDRRVRRPALPDPAADDPALVPAAPSCQLGLDLPARALVDPLRPPVRPSLRPDDPPDAKKVVWAPELIGRGLTLYATLVTESPERFLDAVRAEMEEWAEELVRKVRQLEGEVAAMARLLDGRLAQKQAAKLLPGDGRDDRIAKYERHLHNMLTSTLHELERFQARRAGEPVPPPAVADVNVTVEPGPR